MFLHSRVIAVLLLMGACNTARILGVFYLPSRSHFIITGTLMKELAARGHEVVVLSPFPTGEKLANYTDIDIEGLLDRKGWGSNFFEEQDENFLVKAKRMHNIIHETCEYTLASEGLANILHDSNRKFDLLILSPLLCEALVAIADHFDVPAITFMPQGSNVVMDHLFGNTGPYSYVPNPALPVNIPMTFFDRVTNAVVNTMMDITMNWYLMYGQEELVRKYFPGAPALEKVMDRVQLGFFASHPSIESPRPYMPNMIQIGGIQMERPEKLPEDLQKLLDGANTHGIIYFNFGSNIKSSTLPASTIKDLLQVFKERNETILWKFEEEFKDLPKNVVVRKWIPQRGVLAHPNVKVFITHGGLGGVTESIYNGVPMICIPIFADQFNNCQDSDKKGYAKLIDFPKLKRESLRDALDDVINNPTYRARISARSDLFRSQPISAMDKAIFWTEHVIKHNGAEHLRSPAKRLNWCQIMLLDVVGFILLVVGVAVGMIYWTLGKLWGLIRGAKKTAKKNTKKSKKE